ncbi:hypothetical protein B0H67DRAFT_585705 [Lasiosphaeris hirsuta]|uniref:Uncharacterized protein n=1 Tax=Lasiosphaeris hirsuta TaxID=260670 RepID=A0AA40A934_9PEZI|nr:hypothetical protein B0H67DRAFT_585705 [Lasiosphaeris hirsuta]
MPAPTYFLPTVDEPRAYPVHPCIAARRALYTLPPPAATHDVHHNAVSLDTQRRDEPNEPWPVRVIRARWRRDYRTFLLVHGFLDKYRCKRSIEVPVPNTLTYPNVASWEGRTVFWSAAEWLWVAEDEAERKWESFWNCRRGFLWRGRYDSETQWEFERDGCLRCSVKGGRCSSKEGLKGVWERERCGRCERAGALSCVLWRPWRFDYKKQEREDIVALVKRGICTQEDLDECDEARKKSAHIPGYYGDGRPTSAGVSYALVEKVPGWPKFWAWVRKEGVSPEEVERLAREAIQGEEKHFGGFLTVDEGARDMMAMPRWREEKSEFAGEAHYDETWKGHLDRARAAKEMKRLREEKQEEIEEQEFQERQRQREIDRAAWLEEYPDDSKLDGYSKPDASTT